jgi:hypothetical protein
MNAMLQFATLVITTMFAAAAAVALHWLFLKAAFLMMRPATAPRILARTELVPRLSLGNAKRKTCATGSPGQA